MKSIKTTHYAKIDYDFRPKSFWKASVDSAAVVPRNVEGRARRMRGGKMEQFAADMLNGALGDKSQRRPAYVHPHFMGGEYLPSYGRHEVEIARIDLASTTSDVISLRARLMGPRIGYRVVDEYETEFTLPQQTSLKPFSLGELIRFFNAVERSGGELSWFRFGFVLMFNQCNLECGGDLEDQKDFINVSSNFYPTLASHYRQVIEEWYAAREYEKKSGQT